MSDFISNLVRRGSGLSYTGIYKAIPMPDSLPHSGLAPAPEPGTKMVAMDEIAPELSMADSGTEARMSSTDHPDSIQLEASKAEIKPMESHVRVPSFPPKHPGGQADTHENVFRSVNVKLDPGQKISMPTAPNSLSKKQPKSKKQTNASESHHSPKQPSYLVPHPGIDRTSQLPDIARKSKHPSESKSPSPMQSIHTQIAPQPETIGEDFTRAAEIIPITVKKAAHTKPVPQAQVASESETVMEIRPVIASISASAKGRSIIKPVTSRDYSSGSLTTRETSSETSEPRSVQVRIGTIEIKATTPASSKISPPKPRPQGFGDYIQVRTYANQEW